MKKWFSSLNFLTYLSLVCVFYAHTNLFAQPTTWNSVTVYDIGDIVVSEDATYIATAGSTNQQPPNATFWSDLSVAATTLGVPVEDVSSLDTTTILNAISDSNDEQGQSPSLINFRGQLLDSNGQPVTSSVTIDLRVFPSESGGTQLYIENIGSVEVLNGLYAFQFGSNGSSDFTSVIRQNSETWVEITLNGDVLPRQRFVSVPYALSAGNAQVSPGSITREMLSQDVQLDLNQTTNIAPGSITREMLAPGVLVDGNGSQIIAHGGGGSIDNPFGWDGEIITFTGTTYTVPSDKVLLIVSGDVIKLSSSEAFRQLNSGCSIVPPSTVINSEKGWTGILNDSIESITPIIIKDSPFQVPVGKNLVLTSAAYDISVSGKEVGWMNSRFIFIEQGSITNHSDGFYQSALSG